MPVSGDRPPACTVNIPQPLAQADNFQQAVSPCPQQVAGSHCMLVRGNRVLAYAGDMLQAAFTQWDRQLADSECR